MDDRIDGVTDGPIDDTPLGRVLPLPPAPDGIELRHLRAFVAVAEELNFGRAASRLYLSQPALSRQIRSLERLVGCDLLRRSTHGVELTLAGDALLDRARTLLHGVDDAVAATQAVGGELAGRLARIWEPVRHLTATDGDLQELRNATEQLLSQFPPPPEVTLRSANTGGVPSFLLAPDPGLPPTMLYFHGGGYVMGSAFGYRGLAGALAMAAEACVVVPEYRLAPEHPFPAAVEDSVAALRGLLAAHPAGHVAVGGDSAGSALAIAACLAQREAGGPQPAGLLLASPWTDLAFESPSFTAAEARDPWMSGPRLRRSAGLYLGDADPHDPRASPVHADLRGLPPMLVQVGGDEVLLDDAVRLADRARAAGVPVELEVAPGMWHVWHLFAPRLPEGQAAIDRAGAWLRALPGWA